MGECVCVSGWECICVGECVCIGCLCVGDLSNIGCSNVGRTYVAETLTSVFSLILH